MWVKDTATKPSFRSVPHTAFYSTAGTNFTAQSTSLLGWHQRTAQLFSNQAARQVQMERLKERGLSHQLL